MELGIFAKKFYFYSFLLARFQALNNPLGDRLRREKIDASELIFIHQAMDSVMHSRLEFSLQIFGPLRHFE